MAAPPFGIGGGRPTSCWSPTVGLLPFDGRRPLLLPFDFGEFAVCLNSAISYGRNAKEGVACHERNSGAEH
ncbi:hypothetical protein Q3G72_020475 [Acer saccharum]|nr:hypothetical protein Q3G72_020475 [Acer saccharum]